MTLLISTSTSVYCMRGVLCTLKSCYQSELSLSDCHYTIPNGYTTVVEWKALWKEIYKDIRNYYTLILILQRLQWVHAMVMRACTILVIYI